MLMKTLLAMRWLVLAMSSFGLWLLLISMTIGHLRYGKVSRLVLIIFYNFLALHITQIVGDVGGAPRPRITPHVLVKFAFY